MTSENHPNGPAPGPPAAPASPAAWRAGSAGRIGGPDRRAGLPGGEEATAPPGAPPVPAADVMCGTRPDTFSRRDGEFFLRTA